MCFFLSVMVKYVGVICSGTYKCILKFGVKYILIVHTRFRNLFDISQWKLTPYQILALALCSRKSGVHYPEGKINIG